MLQRIGIYFLTGMTIYLCRGKISFDQEKVARYASYRQ